MHLIKWGKVSGTLGEQAMMETLGRAASAQTPRVYKRQARSGSIETRLAAPGSCLVNNCQPGVCFCSVRNVLLVQPDYQDTPRGRASIAGQVQPGKGTLIGGFHSRKMGGSIPPAVF